MQYEKIIDALVERRGSITAKKFRHGEQWLNTTEKSKFNTLIKSASPEQLALFSELLQSERDSGFHDALVVLSELMNLENLRFSVNGEELPHEPYGTELYFDWVARVSGEPWPQDNS